MNRKERHSRRSRSAKAKSQSHARSTKAPNEAAQDSHQNEAAREGELPSRRKKFPSSINKVNKWYYNLLFVLFLALVAFLFWYGHNFSS